MVKKAEKILITTEKHKVTVIRHSGKPPFRGACHICGPGSAMLGLDEAVAFSGLRTSDIVRDREAGIIHSLETPDGHLLFCSRSLHAPIDP